MSARAGERCQVVARGRAGAYHTLTVAAPAVAAAARAGQFVALRPPADRSCLLRRAFSVHAADPAAGTVGIVFDVVGPGTRALAGVRPGDTLDLLGPLGRPFALPTAGGGPPAPAANGHAQAAAARDAQDAQAAANGDAQAAANRGRPPRPAANDGDGPPACLLVGGGYGTAPLFLLAGELHARGCPVDLLVGASTAARLLDPDGCARLGRSLTVTTDDGSAGRRGVVTDAMPELLARARTGLVYACGPMPMLAAVSRTAAAAGVPCQVAVEERMACATGICFSCVVPVLDRPGPSRMARSCVEGPVLDGAAVAWAELGLAGVDAGQDTAGSGQDTAGPGQDAIGPGPDGGGPPGPGAGPGPDPSPARPARAGVRNP
jgi:dihydroorotate dehydrogenase electron transfer subunit